MTITDSGRYCHFRCILLPSVAMANETRTRGHEVLLLWRNRRHFTQEELAERLGVTVKTYGDYERGKRTPKLGMKKAIAAELHIPVELLTNADWSRSDQGVLASNSFAA